MFIDKNKLRINIYAPFTEEDGTTHANLCDKTVRARVGVTEVEEPTFPTGYNMDTHYAVETDSAPYIAVTRKSDEQIQQWNLAQAKQRRAEDVAAIVVTTTNGNSFDGHEDAQNRMSRAINGLDDDIETVPWVLADNTVTRVNRVELKEALRLSGIAQTEAWVRPYL